MVRLDSGTNLVAVEALVTWRPSEGSKVNLTEVENEVAVLAERFKGPVILDPWQGVLMAQRLRARGIKVIEYPFTGESRRKLFTVILDLIRNGRLKSRPHDDLRRELLTLEVEETAAGWRVDHKPGRHDDHVVATALAAQSCAVELGPVVAEGFDASRHVCKQPLRPIKDEPILIGYVFNPVSACVIGQFRVGFLRIYAALVSEHGGLRNHILNVVRPWIVQYADWAFLDSSIIGRYSPDGDFPGMDETPVLTLEKLLPGRWDSGLSPAKWAIMRELLEDWMGRHAGFEVALQISPEARLLVEALSGQWHRKDNQDRPAENPPWSSIGQAFCLMLSATAPTRERYEKITVESTFNPLEKTSDFDIVL